MRQIEKLRFFFIALIFIFLCGQANSIIVKANFWKTVSVQTKSSYLSAGTNEPLTPPECIPDTHSGFTDDTQSSLFIAAPVLRAAAVLPPRVKRYLYSTSPGLPTITKYHRCIIAIQTVK